MADIRRLVIDVLKPHQPSIVEISQELADMEGVEGVNTSLLEVDEDVKNVKVTLEGRVDFKKVKERIEDSSGSIHSVDEVAAGEKMVEKVGTPQD
ncbi:MAG: DUF211 domain-containing protein [Candidatus Nanohalobium sp.]